MWSARSTPAAASRSSAIRTIGAATSPINRGLWNFDEVRFDFYRDGNSHLEAFKKGLYDVRTETDPGRWETAYDVPARARRPHRQGNLPERAAEAIFSGLVFNTRRPVFSDIRVREAIGMLLDFEWLNHNFSIDRYRRSASYFEGSELSARGRPADARERALLAPFPDAVRADVMDGHLAAAGIRRLRPRPQHAQARARAARPAAGYALDGTVLRSRATRQAAHLRDPGHHQGSGAAGARLLARPQARRHRGARARGRCRAIRPAATHLRLRHDRDTAGTSRSRPATSRRSTGAPPRPMPTARATTWASKAPRSTP